MKLRIALIQMFCEKNAIQQNIDRTITYIQQAIDKNIDIICFPEMNITGYSDPIKYEKMKITIDGPEIKQILDFSINKEIRIIIGFIEYNDDKKPFITQIIVQNGKIINTYRKITIKDEEVLWFTPGHTIEPFDILDTRMGMSICADIENESVFSSYADRNTKIIFESAAPGLTGDITTRDWDRNHLWWKNFCNTFFSKYSKKYNLWIFVSTQAGRTLDEDFPGGAYIFNPKGERVLSTGTKDPCSVFVELDLTRQRINTI